MITVDPIMSSVLRLGLAALLLSSAWHKLRDLRAFRAAIEGYALVPGPALPFAVAVLPGAELIVGTGLLLPRFSAVSGLVGALLMAIYTLAIGINLARGRTRIDCGCAGPAGALPLSRPLLVRNAVLIVLALGAAMPAAARTLRAADVMVVVAATGVFTLLYASAETALANAARWRAAGGHSPQLRGEHG